MDIKWQSSLCSWSGPCLSACCCPCIVFGKTQARLENPEDKDPSCCNAHCIGFCVLEMAHLGWVLGTFQRGQVRHKYNIPLGRCGRSDDCCVSFWCPCCGIRQQANEVEKRQARLDTRGYRPQPGMSAQQPW